MSQPGWLNDNESRDFPLVCPATGTDLAKFPPQAVLVDAGFLLGPDVLFDSATDSVWLDRITAITGGFAFVFACSATDLELTFEVPSGTEEFAVIKAESDPAGPETCEDVPAWEGYLQVGLISKLISLVGLGGEAVAVEPACIQNLSYGYVRSLNVANVDRVKAPEPCAEAESDQPREIIAGGRCIAGEVAFREGYNCEIRQNPTGRRIRITASVGGGQGLPCDEVPLTEEESENSTSLLTGGPACNDRITSVNGIFGSVVELQSIQGVSISADPENPSKLIVSVDLSGIEGGAITDFESIGGEGG